MKFFVLSSLLLSIQAYSYDQHEAYEADKITCKATEEERDQRSFDLTIDLKERKMSFSGLSVFSHNELCYGGDSEKDIEERYYGGDRDPLNFTFTTLHYKSSLVFYISLDQKNIYNGNLEFFCSLPIGLDDSLENEIHFTLSCK